MSAGQGRAGQGRVGQDRAGEPAPNAGCVLSVETEAIILFDLFRHCVLLAKSTTLRKCVYVCVGVLVCESPLHVGA